MTLSDETLWKIERGLAAAFEDNDLRPLEGHLVKAMVLLDTAKVHAVQRQALRLLDAINVKCLGGCAHREGADHAGNALDQMQGELKAIKDALASVAPDHPLLNGYPGVQDDNGANSPAAWHKDDLDEDAMPNTPEEALGTTETPRIPGKAYQAWRAGEPYEDAHLWKDLEELGDALEAGVDPNAMAGEMDRARYG